MVEVFFVTNREPDDRLRFGIRDSDVLTYGMASVRIPAGHPAGELDRGLDVVDVRVVDEYTFHQTLARQSQGGGLLTFVHGYNNSFDYAARRAAQVSHDLERPLTPVLFSWPTRGGTWFATAKYTFDENAAARSSSSFAKVLTSLRRRHAVPNVLLAHSMGSRVAVEALVDLARTENDIPPFERVVLAAPDIDAKVFVGRYLDVVSDLSNRLTVYCANDDRALKLSRGVHGGYDRLGSCRSSSLGRLDREGLEVVDASMLYVDLVDHDKVVSSPRLLRDLRWVVDGVPASHPGRGLQQNDRLFQLPP